MTLSLYVDAYSFGLNLWDVLQGNVVGTTLIISGCEQGDRHDLNVAHFDHLSFKFAVEPLVVKLLESLHEAIHLPILFRLDSLALQA